MAPLRNLYYGDNLEILRKRIKDDSIDLCYIDPPFNSKRNYHQIFDNVQGEDLALVQAFIDTWTWDAEAENGFDEILSNEEGRYQAATVDLIKGLRAVLGKGSLFAYLVSITRRVAEIRRVLKPTGVFFLHCDPTASHYLKLVLDTAFCFAGGAFQNEIAWCYSHGGKSKKRFGKKHDVIFFYTKTDEYTFNAKDIRIAMKSGKESFGGKLETDENGRIYRLVYGTKNKQGKTKYYKYYLDEGKVPEDWWTDINSLQATSAERLGYPTQKPLALLERLISACSNEGDLVLDAYCGCGTTVDAAEKLKRQWIGIDITYQAISVILDRLSTTYGADFPDSIAMTGIPKDIDSAKALAAKRDDRLRKEFEKWALLTYTNNRALINEKKGADGGIDGIAFFKVGRTDNAKIAFQVKSGGVQRGDIAKLKSDMESVGASMSVLITLEEPTKPMMQYAKAIGSFKHEEMGRSYDVVSIVTVREIVEEKKRLEIPMSVAVLKAALREVQGEQLPLL